MGHVDLRDPLSEATQLPRAVTRGQPDHRDTARAVRLLGSVVAIATAIRLITVPVHSGSATLQRALLTVLAGTVALAASERRSRTALNALALALLLAVAGHAIALTALEPTSLWKLGAVVTGVLLSAALFLQWPWTWQIALSLALFCAATVTCLWLAGDNPDAREQLLPVALTVAAAAAVSIAGARLLWLSRQRLAASEARYRRLFEAAPVGIVLVDAGGTILDLNDNFAALVGRPVHDLRGTGLNQHLAPIQPDGKDPEHFFRDHFALAINGQRQETVAYFRTAKGASLETETIFWRVETRDGPLVQVMVRDLTEHRRLERQEERRRRLDALGKFAGNLAQRFGSLFAEISGKAEALRLAAGSERDRNLAGEIVATAAEGSRLSRELVRFGRQERLTVGRVDTRTLVRQMETLARAVLSADITIEDALPDLAGDKDYLAHAVLQLVLNAREAMPDGGKLTISAGTVRVRPGTALWPGASAGEYVRISISDTGSGMDPAVLDRVFEPFLSAAPLYEVRSAGIPAVYGIVRAHRGSVRIDSAPGRGTSVHLLIPRWEEESVIGTAELEPSKRVLRASVLLVEADELMRSAAGVDAGGVSRARGPSRRFRHRPRPRGRPAGGRGDTGRSGPGRSGPPLCRAKEPQAGPGDSSRPGLQRNNCSRLVSRGSRAQSGRLRHSALRARRAGGHSCAGSG